MEYIEFGKNRDVVWVIEAATADMTVKALATRGYTDVTRNTPVKGIEEPQSVWEENRYLGTPWNDNGTANRPETVYMLFRRTEKGGPEVAILASTSNDVVTCKVADALKLMFSNWEIDIRPVGQPE